MPTSNLLADRAFSFAGSYCGDPVVPADVWNSWNLDPVLIVALVLIGFVGHRAFGPSTLRARKTFWAAIALLAVLFVSPLCALTVSLFSVRVVHHVVLVALVGPLLALALKARFPVLASGTARLMGPLVALHAVVFWAWHAPDLYVAGLEDPLVYWITQLSLIGTAMLAWLAILAARRRGPAMGWLLFLAMQMGFLGALLVFAGTPLYVPHLLTTAPFGLDAVADQQLGGLIMWVPASIPYFAGLVVMLVGLLGSSGARTAR